MNRLDSPCIAVCTTLIGAIEEAKNKIITDGYAS